MCDGDKKNKRKRYVYCVTCIDIFLSNANDVL